MNNYTIPLLHDYHNHTSFYLALKNCLDLRNVKDYNTAIKLMEELKEDINVVLGWTFSEYNKDDIEALPAVLICEGSLHNYIMNQKTKDKLADKFPEIVANIEDLAWVERNLYTIMKFIPQIKKITEEDVANFFDYLLKEYQIYEIEDMLLADASFIDLFERAGYADRCKYWIDINSYKKMSEFHKQKITGLKVFLDGAIGPETAALNGYVNSKSNGGMKLYTNAKLAEELLYAAKEKKAVSVHALGELVIQQVIDVVKEYNITLPCLRIEHAQYISLEMAQNCKKLGITLSMQLNFSSESISFKGKLTDAYLQNNNPFRMLIDQAGFVPGKDLIFGSDGMPHGALAALQNALFPPNAGQKITLEEFIAGYCTTAGIPERINFDIKDEQIINLVTLGSKI